MKSSLSIVSIIAVAVILLALGDYAVSSHAVPTLREFMASSTESNQRSASTVPTVKGEDIKAPHGVIHALIADTEESRAKGLGGRDSLPQDQGMLFVFSDPGIYDFWMKDVNFPLDMVWLDWNKSVIGATKNISMDTYPSTFSPPSPVSYVLELNAGAADKFGIATGTKLSFQ